MLILSDFINILSLGFGLRVRKEIYGFDSTQTQEDLPVRTRQPRWSGLVHWNDQAPVHICNLLPIWPDWSATQDQKSFTLRWAAPAQSHAGRSQRPIAGCDRHTERIQKTSRYVDGVYNHLVLEQGRNQLIFLVGCKTIVTFCCTIFGRGKMVVICCCI